jgi:sodium/bile acid cotransporter 7
VKFKIDNFVLAIIAVVIIAYFFPEPGSGQSKIPLDTISSIGVSLIFFFYGLKLSPEKIRSGLKNWKLHVLIQASTYLLFPAIVIIAYPFLKEAHFSIWLAFLFLAALPSTVSSSVVMVSIAKGNIPAAIFNASISGLIGIAITPLWVGLFLEQAAADFDLGHIYLKLLTEILLPVVLGLALQRFGHSYTVRYNKYLTLFDKTIVLLIVYKSFAESFEKNVFSSVHVFDLLVIALAVVLLFYGIYGIVGWIARRLGFNREDTITARFCGTKKSLVHGTVFSKVLFSASMPAGLILLPLMLFHAIQIFIVSIIASRLAKEKEI